MFVDPELIFRLRSVECAGQQVQVRIVWIGDGLPNVREDELGILIRHGVPSLRVPVLDVGLDALLAVELQELARVLRVGQLAHVKVVHLARVAPTGLAPTCFHVIRERAILLQDGRHGADQRADKVDVLIVHRPLVQDLYVAQDIVFIVVGRQHGQIVHGLIVLQVHRVLLDQGRDLGNRCAQRDVLELGAIHTCPDILHTIGVGIKIANVRDDDVRPVARVDGRHIVLVAVHVEALDEPGVTGTAITDSRQVFHAGEGTPDGSANHDARRLLDGVHAGHPNEPGAGGKVAHVGAGPAVTESRDLLSGAIRARQRHIAGIEGDGAVEPVRHNIARVPDIQFHAVVKNVHHVHHMVQELHVTISRDGFGVQAQDGHLVAIQRKGIQVQLLDGAAAVEIRRNVGQIEQRHLALHLDNVREAVKVAVQAGEAIAEFGVGRACVDRAILSKEIIRPHADREDDARGLTDATPGGQRNVLYKLGIHQQVGELLHDGWVVLIGLVEHLVGIEVLIPMVWLVPLAEPDFFGRIQATGIDLVVEPRRLVLVKGLVLVHPDGVPGDRVLDGGLYMLREERGIRQRVRPVLRQQTREKVPGSRIACALVHVSVHSQGVKDDALLRSNGHELSHHHKDEERYHKRSGKLSCFRFL